MFFLVCLFLRCHCICKSQRQKSAAEFVSSRICASWEATTKATMDTWWHWNDMYGLQNWTLYYGKEQKQSTDIPRTVTLMWALTRSLLPKRHQLRQQVCVHQHRPARLPVLWYLTISFYLVEVRRLATVSSLHSPVKWQSLKRKLCHQGGDNYEVSKMRNNSSINISEGCLVDYASNII